MFNYGKVYLDCLGLDLIKGETPQTILGIFNKVVDAMRTGKEIVAYNCVWDGRPVTPISCFAIQFSATEIIVTSSTLQIIITSSDVVTINNLVAD